MKLEEQRKNRKIAILFAFHNRKNYTREMCKSLKLALVGVDATFRIFCCDDNSSDESSLSVKQIFDDAEIVKGSGDLFWNRGMLEAFKVFNLSDFSDTADILCVNDDCIFFEKEMGDFIRMAMCTRRALVGAQLVHNNDIVYGGGRISKNIFRKTFSMETSRVHVLEPTDWVHFNSVYIPNEILKKISFLDPFYHHSFGDIDYSLRARRAGFDVFLAPPVGSCLPNDGRNTYLDAGLPLRKRLRLISSEKGLPFRQRYYFARKNIPVYMIGYWLIKPYLFLFASFFYSRLKKLALRLKVCIGSIISRVF
jgi:hypothetical protein